MYVYFVSVDNGTSARKHIFRNLVGQRLAGGGGGLRKVAGCFLVALSERCENKRPFARMPWTLTTLPSSFLSLSLTPQETI